MDKGTATSGYKYYTRRAPDMQYVTSGVVKSSQPQRDITPISELLVNCASKCSEGSGLRAHTVVIQPAHHHVQVHMLCSYSMGLTKSQL